METGTTLAHYAILDRLGAGGMGEVFRARDTRLNREVALKLLPPHLTASEDRHLRFHREAQMLAALSHPGIAAIHSLEEDGDRHFLVLELVEGEDLSARLARGPLPVREALTIALAIALALESAHERGIVHRDLRPQYVKLTDSGAVKVLDFGLAKAWAADGGAVPGAAARGPGSAITVSPAMTTLGEILGTAAYMSPEQARGREVDRRADVWALGCVLYEMLTGRLAFPGETVSDTLAAVLRAEPDWSLLPAGLPAGLPRLLARCLEKDQRRRIHDVADVRIELEDALQELEGERGGANGAAGAAGARATGGAGGGRGGAPAARSGRAVSALAVLGWAALAAALSLWHPWRAADPTVPARLTILTYSGRDWSPTVSPDGRIVAFVSDRDGTTRIWLKQMIGGGEEPLTEGPDDLPRFSPDGSQVLFVRNVEDGRCLFRAAVVGGRLSKILDDVVEADWSPDGARVAFLRGRPEGGDNVVLVGVADVQTGAERILTEIENRACYGIRWSPDGRTIALCEGSLTGNIAEDSNVDLVDADTGELRRLKVTGWSGPYTAVSWSPSGGAFVVGQAVDFLSHATGTPGQMMEYDLGSGDLQPLFWSPVRLPRGGFGFSTLAVLGQDRIVLEEQTLHAELLEFDWTDGGEPGPAHPLTRGLGRDRQPVFSPDGELVMFSSNRSGNVDLWLLDRTSGQLRQLTDDPADDWDPAFTPDGRQVVWSTNRGGNMEIWMAALDGSRARQVSSDGVDAENATMTPDGQWLVYGSANDAKRGVWKIRPDGTEATLLESGSFILPEVSPDGRHALFVQIRNLDYVIQAVEIESGELVPFEIVIGNTSRHENVVFGRARWTPDGRGIVYIGQDGRGLSGVYVQDFVPGADTTASRRKVAGFSPGYTTESLGLSPDGRRLVISAMYDRRTLKLAEDVALATWR
jgi:Tol biopolymer transport system component